MRRFLNHIRRSRFWSMRIGGILLLLILIIGIGIQRQSGGHTRFMPYVSFALAQATDATPNGSGFLWTDTVGWISMNCRNNWGGRIVENRCADGNYGVRVSVNETTLEGTLSGYGWSPNIGLICFGETCGECPDDAHCSEQRVGSNVMAAFDMNTMEEVSGGEGSDGKPITRRVAFINGFGRVLALANDDQSGWIQLNGTARGGPITVGAWLDNNGAITISGSGWQQNADRTGVGWVYFGDSPPGNAPCSDATCGSACDPTIDLACKVTLPPARETECSDFSNGQCCANGRDDDRDINYAADSIHNPADRDPQDEDGTTTGGGTTGVDCFDYDCAGARFYSRNKYAPDIRDQFNAEHCGAPPGNNPADNKENGFSVADCFDGLDNDLDVLVWDDTQQRFLANPNPDAGVDCADTDCAGAEYGSEHCTKQELEENVNNGCYDGFDNDGDEQVDCADDQCNDAADGYALCPERIPSCLCASHPSAEGYEVPDCNVLTNDRDGDGVVNSCDNCPANPNSGQEDTDADGIQGKPGDGKGGDECDPVAWLETREGSLYAHLLSGTAPPLGSNTATYCILTAANASGTSVEMGQFRSGQCRSPSGINLPDVGVTQFRIIPGDDTIILVAGTGTNPVRAYLNLQSLRPPTKGVVPLTNENVHTSLRRLSGNRYYFKGDLHINKPIKFPADNDGVTILVDGNLYLDAGATLSYAPISATSRLADLTSIAWVIVDDTPEIPGDKGNVIIHPDVGALLPESDNGAPDLVGTFLSTGTFSTGTKTPGPDKSLTIYGLVVAREFRLQRQFASITRGSELIIYDGRAILNPPPGLSDIVKALPTFRSVAP